MKSKKKIQKDVDTVLQMADRYLDEWKEDIDNGVGGDGARYLSEAHALADARPVILAGMNLYLRRLGKEK